MVTLTTMVDQLLTRLARPSLLYLLSAIERMRPVDSPRRKGTGGVNCEQRTTNGELVISVTSRPAERKKGGGGQEKQARLHASAERLLALNVCSVESPK